MSINPGTSEVVNIANAVGGVRSETLNPQTPVEYGRTVSGGIEDSATEATELPLP